MRFSLARALLCLIAFLAFCFPSPSLAVVETAESKIANAAAAFYSGKFAVSLEELEKAVRLQPGNRDALELKALVLQKMGNKNEAYKVYLQLIEQAQKDNLPKEEYAAYVFQRATMELSANQLQRALRNFQWLSRTDFNTDATAFFYAVANYRSANLTVADQMLEKLIASGANENRALVASALYYRAKISLEQDDVDMAIAYLEQAKQQLVNLEDDPNPEIIALSNQINQLIDNALAEPTSARVVAGVETLTSVDSNPLLLSRSLADKHSVTTAKQTFVAAIAAGRPSSRQNSWSTSFRSMMDYNFNSEAKTSEFIANEAEAESLFVTNDSSGRFGVMAHGLALFANQSTSGGQDFFNHILSGAVDLVYVRMSSGARYRFELGTGFNSYTNDGDYTEKYQRSGMLIESSFSWSRDRERGKYNPLVRLQLLNQNAKGTEFRGSQARLTLLNVMYMRKWQWLTQLALGYSIYPNRELQARNDQTYGLDVVGSRLIGKQLSFLLRAGWISNFSNVSDPYTYERYTIGTGLRYLF